MQDDFLEEIRELRETLSRVSRRLDMLEGRAASSPGVAVPPSPPVAATTPAPSAPPPVPSLVTRIRGAAPIASEPDVPRENLELKIGRYWLNRIGILSLVLGTAFFLVYSFQYMGPVAKLAVGYAVGAALMILGLRLERKQGIEWYARGLLGGAWAVIYFATYAMYHVPETKVLTSAPVDLVLLLLVAAGAVRHALTYRSQAITAFAFLLGFLTTGISEVTSFTFLSSVILIGSLVVLSVRMRWHGLLLCGMVGSYLTHIVSVQRHIVYDGWTYTWADTIPQAVFWLHASFLGLYWVGYTLGVLAFDEREEPRRKALTTTTVVNGLAFTLLLLPRIASAYRGATYIALLVIGGVYLALSFVATKRALPSVSSAHLLLGLSLVTLAIPEKLAHRTAAYFYFVEVAALAWLGVVVDRWAYRLFAMVLGFFALIWVLPYEMRPAFAPWNFSRWAIGSVAVLCYAAAAAASKRLKPDRFRWYGERYTFHLYGAAACIALWSVTWVTASFPRVAFYMTLEAAGVTVLGWLLRDRVIRMYGALWFATPVLLTLFGLVLSAMEAAAWYPRSALAVVGFLYATSLLYRAKRPEPAFGIERHFTNLYAVTASLLLAGILWHDVARNWLSLAWAIEGLALVVVGFKLPDKYYRMSGLTIFAILLLKVLFVDLAAAETIYRILSFAVAGAILLLASFGYAKFTQKGTKPEA